MIFSVWWICFRCWSLIFFFTWNDKFLVAVRILIQAPHRFQYFPTDQSSTLCQQAYLFSENDKLKGMNQDLQPPRDFSFICPLLVKWGGGGFTIFFIAIVQTSFMMICKTDFIFKYLCHEYFYFNHLILV